jgi:predicted Zn-dependent protease
LADQLARPELTDAQKAEEGRKLIDLARLQKDDALAAELTAVLMLHEKKPEAAEAACLAAQKLGRRSPELLLDLASALLRAGQADGYERTMWKLLSDFPGFDAGYVSLYQHHLARASAASAVKVVNTWLQARPASIGARLLKAGLYMQVNQMADAERLLLACFRDQPHSARVVSGLRQYFAQCNRKADLIALLEQERRQRPHNRVVVGELVWLYVADGRTAQAQAALDAMRKAVESDGELLYYAAHLYERVDRKAVTEEVLSQVLKLDPAHPAANNDLGYLWADEGRNLDEAETLIRAATASEPDNAAFLDSLGWLQYKRGRFDQALRSLQQALVRSSLPDPVVLDHLGDTLYRLNQAGEAARTWQQSLQRLEAADPERLDLKLLKEQLVGKLKSHERGERVKVAPLGAQTRDNQAKG